MCKTTTVTLITAALAIVAGVGFDLRAATAQDAEVTKAHDAFRARWAQYDADAIGKMLAEDFFWISRAGTIGDKASMVEAFRQRRMAKIDHSENLRVRMYGDTGVVTAVNFGSTSANRLPRQPLRKSGTKKAAGGCWFPSKAPTCRSRRCISALVLLTEMAAPRGATIQAGCSLAVSADRPPVSYQYCLYL
jgi:hypothetical protein